MKPIHLWVLPLLFILLSCEFESYQEYAIEEYNGDLEWTRVIKNADWGNRYGHAATVFNNKIWVIGGYNPGKIKGDTYYEDVWSSADGSSWDLVVEKAPFQGRKGHCLLSFDDGNGEAMYLIGGFSVNEDTGKRQYANDVWKSTNGKDWELIKERVYPDQDTLQNDWFPRMHHACAVASHNNTTYMYLTGGYTQLEGQNSQFGVHYFNDVWRSEDGIEWERLNNNDYGIRAEHACAVDPETQTIYIHGGTPGTVYDTEINSTEPIDSFQLVWSSNDGINWRANEFDENMDGNLLWRRDHEMVYYENQLWVLPGRNKSTLHYHFTNWNVYPIWCYHPDGSYQQDGDGAPADARHAYASLVFDNKIWILGGFTSTQGQSNDVWSASLK